MKKYLDRLAVLFLSVALFFLFLEMFSRVLLPVLKINHGYVGLGVSGKYVLEFPGLYLKDRELFWKLEPLQSDFNSLGYRDREFSPRKEQGTFRVICMGDSVTFGYPAEKGNTYPKILEKLLAQHFSGRKVEVLNLGVPGYTSYQGLELFRREAIKFAPDLIIVYYGVNDRSSAQRPDKEQIKLPNLAVATENYLNRFQFYRLFVKVMLHFRYSPDKAGPLVCRVGPQDYKSNLEKIGQLAKENNIRALFLVHPVFYDPLQARVVDDLRYAAPEIIEHIDIYDIFKKREKDAALFFVDDVRPLNFHLSESGQRVLAEEICHELIGGSSPASH